MPNNVAPGLSGSSGVNSSCSIMLILGGTK